MKDQRFRASVIACFLLSTVILSSGCDTSFYLTEKEFYALRSQIFSESVANQVFSNAQNGQIQVNFDNSTSPPRVQSSTLENFMRTSLPTLGILEGYPSNALQIGRVSGEIEKQLDNWLADRLRLYAGANNSQARLERVDQVRVRFMNNPTFDFIDDKMTFDTTLQMTVDCRIRVDALDPFLDFFFNVNGTYDVSITVNDLRLRGESSFHSINKDGSLLQFKLAPSVGNVAVTDRGPATPASVKTGIGEVVKVALSVKAEEKFYQKYDHFALKNCGIGAEFGCEYEARPVSRTPDLHTVARGTDNKLYTAMRRNNVWSNYRELCCTSNYLQIDFTSDPSLAVSSAGTAELAATTASGEIYYMHYQNGWKNFRFLIPPIPPGTPANVVQGLLYTGKPAIIATAPGQVEIVIARANGTLVHLRRINGLAWSAPVVLNLPTTVQGTAITFRDPVMVQTGKYLSLVAKTNTNRLYVANFNIELGVWSPGLPLTQAENVNFVPAAAASGDGRVDLAYVGMSGTVYHRYLSNIDVTAGGSGFSASVESVISANVNATPILVASGYRQLDLIARGTDNRLYYNHFTGPQSPAGLIDGRNIVQGWSGWSGLNGNFYGTQLLSNENTEEFAVTATKTGKLDVLARIRANTFSTTYKLHHNGFDAGKFGKTAWKAVHWRGYERVGDRNFLGRPALAAFDVNSELVFVGSGRFIYDAQQGTDFISPPVPQLFSLPPVDPLVVTSGKGLVDIITIGTDRKIKHLRSLNDHRFQTPTIPGQNNLTFQRRPAVVGYGEGQLDVIGVSTTGSIHHWRYLNGAWQNPQQIAGSVSSPPILVNTGGGQLEFFAVGGDGKLYRWRFLNGGWGASLQIPSTFTIDASKFAQGSATTWGNGTVDLAVVTTGNWPNNSGAGIYHRHVEPRDDTITLPNQPAQEFRKISIRGRQPFIAAFNQNEKIVIYSDTVSLSYTYHWLDGSGVWQIGVIANDSNLPMRLGGLAQHSSGATAISIDGTGKLYYHDRLTAASPRFDFAPVLEQTLVSQLAQPQYRPTIASHGGQ